MLILCFILIVILFICLLCLSLEVLRLRLGNDAQDKLNKRLSDYVVENREEIYKIKNNIFQ